MKKLFYSVLLLSAFVIQACHKDKKIDPNKTPTTLDLIRDSIFLYAQEDYLWHSSLPTYSAFNPRSYTNADEITALSNEVNAISQFAVNPATGKPYEYYAPAPGEAKYSF